MALSLVCAGKSASEVALASVCIGKSDNEVALSSVLRWASFQCE